MKKKYIICCGIGIIVVALIVGAFLLLNGKEESNTKKEVKIPTIEFPQYVGAYNGDIIFENNFSGNIKNEGLLEKAFVLKNEINEKELNKIADKLSFDSEDILREEEEFILYSKDDKSLMLYSNGTFDYQVKRITDEDKMTISDDKCREIAEEAIVKSGLAGDDCTYSKIGYTLLEEIGVENSETVLEKQVYFKRKIDNINVSGKNMLVVTIDADGEIISILSNYMSIDDEIEVQQVIPVDEAIEKAKELEGMIEMDEKTDRVEIENVEVVYWEDSSTIYDVNTIQPVYKITGKSYCNGEEIGIFAAYEQAIQ